MNTKPISQYLLSIWWLMLILLVGIVAHAQNGPGGVQATDGTSNLILWLDANQIDSVFDQNNVTTWYDASGSGNHFSQSVADSKPNWRDGEVNGFPAVHFDGGERLEGTFTGGLSAPVSVFAVTFFDSLNQGNSNYDFVFSAGSSTGSNTMMNLARYQADATDGDKYYNFDGTNSNYGPVLNGQQWMMLANVQQSSATFHELYVNGTSETVESLMSNALSTNADARVGDWADSPSNAYHLNGSIAEIVVFDKILLDAERRILHSYLAAKYDLSNGEDRYSGDDNGNGDHDREVIGLGTESDGSQIEAHGAGLRLLQNANFGTGDYLLAGHATASNSVNTSDVGGGYAARWDRVWWFDVTDGGGTMTADITFDFSEGGLGGSPGSSASDYQLIYRAAASGNWSTIATATSISGDQITFTNVALSADGRYTLATLDQSGEPVGEDQLALGCDGPGGIGSQDGTSDLELWLDAEALNGVDEDPLVSFADQSGNGSDANELDATNIPVVKTNVRNGMDVIRFDGNDYIQGDLTSALTASSTVVAVATFHQDQGAGENDYVISVGNPTTTNRHLSISRRRNDVPADHNKYYSWDGNTTRFGPVISTNAWNIFYQEQNTSAPFHSLYLDGASQSVTDYSAAFSATSTDYRLGLWLNNFDNGIDGDIAEVIIFSRSLNSAERLILTAYLGAKYDISVTGDLYTGDDSGNGDHDRDVAGIGIASDGSNACATSAGMKLTSNSNFETDDYVLFGHNVEANAAQDSDIGHSSVTLEERWSRTWWLDVTDAGNALTVDVAFDYSEAGIPGVFPGGSTSNYQLLYRSSTSGNWSTVATASSISGDQISFSNVSLSGDGQYTIGTTARNASPLPVELLDFSATITTQKKVWLQWETASEINNSHFTVERSRDGHVFEAIGSVAGAGMSHEYLQYELTDEDPLQGVSYYRLLQTDFNGSSSYSGLERVQLQAEQVITVYPNPTEDFVFLEGERLTGVVRVFDLAGREVTSRVNHQVQANGLSLDVSALRSGWYTLQVDGVQVKLLKL